MTTVDTSKMATITATMPAIAPPDSPVEFGASVSSTPINGCDDTPGNPASAYVSIPS